MTDRDNSTGPESEEPDGIPREPSKDELGGEVVYPAEAAAAENAAPETFAPKKAAWIALGILALIMFAMTGIGLSQNSAQLQRSYVPVQVTVTAQVLEKDKVVNYTSSETTAAADKWKAKGTTITPTAAQMAEVLNASVGPDKQVTEQQVAKSLKKNKVNLKIPTVEQIQSSLRTQTIIFAVVGLAAAVAAYFYRQRANWARVLGMFVSGLVTIMFVMQMVNGSFSIIVLAIVVSGGAAFFLLMKGRLVAPVAIGAGGTGGILGSLFRPRPRQDE